MQKPIDETLFEQIVNEEEDEDEEEVCPICLEVPELPFSLPCGHKGHYNCFMGIQNSSCPLCRASIPKELYRKAEIDKDIFKETEKLLWLYKTRSGAGWWFFDADIAKEIEDSYQLYLKDKEKKQINYIVRGKIYTIDFTSMIQTSPQGAKRDVYRRSADNDRRDFMILGVGGLTSKKPF